MQKKFNSKWTRPVEVVLLGLIIVFSAVAFVPGTVLAQSTSATPNTPVQSNPNANRIANLENAYSREQAWLTTQSNNLQKMNQVVVNAQKLIDLAKAKGWNVNSLQEALDAFNQQIPNAQSLHDTAATILSTHDGFDANGKVTDVNQAYQTARDAMQSLRDAHDIMRQVVFDLRSVLQNFRNAHGKAANQSVTPTPTATSTGG